MNSVNLASNLPLLCLPVAEAIAVAVAHVHHHGLRRTLQWAVAPEPTEYLPGVEPEPLPAFWTLPAAAKNHHAYRGGLAAHTLEVVAFALHIAEAYPCGAVDVDVLITAAVWHDHGKQFEYEPNADPDPEAPAFTWSGGFYARGLTHIPGGAIDFAVAAEAAGVPADLRMQVCHAILAHHGIREWGSPVSPMTIEAHILHMADNLSAKFGPFRDFPAPEADTEATEATEAP